VCTITVNSSDEKEMFRQRLPADQYEFVELVERGRPIGSHRPAGKACAAISSSSPAISTAAPNSIRIRSPRASFLPVAEMERASAATRVPAVLAIEGSLSFRMQYAERRRGQVHSSEVGRSLVRAGYKPEDAGASRAAGPAARREQPRPDAQDFHERAGHLRLLIGRAAGTQRGGLLGRYLQAPSIAEVGNGRANSKLLGHFAAESMIAVSGSSESDPRGVYRRESCQFVDDRLTPAAKLEFIHGLLRRDMAEVRMFLDRIEGLFASLSESERQAPSFLRGARRDYAR
jgi:hypothetical protein